MCGIKESAEQKPKLEEMMLELLELCREKEFYCEHDSIKDLIGMTMNTMLLSINLKSQRLDKEKQEVKNIVEQATKRKTRIIESLQNFTIIHKMSSISNTPQISLVMAITPDLPTEEPDNSLKELNAKIADTILESLFPFSIRVEDSDSHMEEIDLFLVTDDLMPPGIENNDYESKGDIYFLEVFLSNDPLPFPKNESSNFDHHDDPSFPRPPPEPPYVEVFFNFEPDTSVLTTKMVKGISEHYVLMPNILPTLHP
nr:hypothetical protein [Tanacetum cinerariifolium]